jgi:hypothetical protein
MPDESLNTTAPVESLVDADTPIEASSEKVASPEREPTLADQIERLQFDTVNSEIPTMNFDPETGDDLREQPEVQTEKRWSIMLVRAEGDLRKALDIREETKFSKYIGSAIPERVVADSGSVTEQSLQERVTVFREDIAYLVEKARAKGLRIPSFNPENGTPIPQDSLVAFEAMKLAESKANPQSELSVLDEDVQIGFQSLETMKRIKREDAAGYARIAREDANERKRMGLPSA